MPLLHCCTVVPSGVTVVFTAHTSYVDHAPGHDDGDWLVLSGNGQRSWTMWSSYASGGIVPVSLTHAM